MPGLTHLWKCQKSWHHKCGGWATWQLFLSQWAQFLLALDLAFWSTAISITVHQQIKTAPIFKMNRSKPKRLKMLKRSIVIPHNYWIPVFKLNDDLVQCTVGINLFLILPFNIFLFMPAISQFVGINLICFIRNILWKH